MTSPWKTAFPKKYLPVRAHETALYQIGTDSDRLFVQKTFSAGKSGKRLTLCTVRGKKLLRHIVSALCNGVFLRLSVRGASDTRTEEDCVTLRQKKRPEADISGRQNR